MEMAMVHAHQGDTERFRLRRFAEMLAEADEVEVVDDPTPLIDVAARLEGNSKAVWFRNVGPEGAELIGNVMASRRRLALAFGVPEREAMNEMLERLKTPVAPIEVSEAPVQQVVRLGAAADLTALPVHLQHKNDGAPYISATLDFAREAVTGFTNVGMRRVMLRGRRSAGIDLNAPSDLRAMFASAHDAGERLPYAVTIGFHPLDALAALTITPPIDELAVMGALRGTPVPVVKCVTNEIYVPADAEIVLEGWLDPAGWSEPEGPYGEYVGYYGCLKQNPVFHIEAITMREDALFQTVTIGGRSLATTDTAQICALKTEGAVRAALQTAVREPVAVAATASSGGMYNIRLSLRQRVPGEARNAIAAVFGAIADVKHVFVCDPDIDVFDPAQVDWALATRFQADQDLSVADGFRVVPLDPSLEGARIGAKAGFDLTIPFGRAEAQEWSVPEAPVREFREPAAQQQLGVRAALEASPCNFLELMEAAGSDDGREIVRELERLYEGGALARNSDGRYRLA